MTRKYVTVSDGSDSSTMTSRNFRSKTICYTNGSLRLVHLDKRKLVCH